MRGALFPFITRPPQLPEGYAGDFVARLSGHFAEPRRLTDADRLLLVEAKKLELGHNPLVQEVKIEFEVRDESTAEQSLRSEALDDGRWHRRYLDHDADPSRAQIFVAPMVITYVFTNEQPLEESLTEFEGFAADQYSLSRARRG